MGRHVDSRIASRKFLLLLCFSIWIASFIPFGITLLYVPTSRLGYFFETGILAGVLGLLLLSAFLSVAASLRKKLDASLWDTVERETLSRFQSVWERIPKELSDRYGYTIRDLGVPKIITKNFWFIPTVLVTYEAVQRMSDDELQAVVTNELVKRKSTTRFLTLLLSKFLVTLSMFPIMGVFFTLFDPETLGSACLLLLYFHVWSVITVSSICMMTRLVTELNDLQTVKITKRPTDLIPSLQKYEAVMFKKPEIAQAVPDTEDSVEIELSLGVRMLSDFSKSTNAILSGIGSLVPKIIKRSLELTFELPFRAIGFLLGVKNLEKELSFDDRAAKLAKVYV